MTKPPSRAHSGLAPCLVRPDPEAFRAPDSNSDGSRWTHGLRSLAAMTLDTDPVKDLDPAELDAAVTAGIEMARWSISVGILQRFYQPLVEVSVDDIFATLERLRARRLVFWAGELTSQTLVDLEYRRPPGTGPSHQLSGAHYLALGRFVVQFEHTMGSIHHGIAQLLHRNSSQDDYQLVAIALARLTADPITDMYFAMVSQACQLPEPSQRKLRKLRSRVDQLIASRNDLVHSTWYGQVKVRGEPPTASEADFMRTWRNGRGITAKIGNVAATDIEGLADESEAIDRIISAVNSELPDSSRVGAVLEDVTLGPSASIQLRKFDK